MFTPKAWWALLGWPGAITLASLASAWAAIGLAVAGELMWSVLAALWAFVLDMADGFLARRLGRESTFGAFLDSMADLVNYSLYAAVLTVTVLVPGVAGWIVGFVIIATGMMRLVRFSVEGFDDGPIKYYRGVVTCHVSLAAMVLVIVAQFTEAMLWPSVVVLTVLSVLQLTGIKMRKTGRQAWWASLVIPVAAGAILWLP